MARPGCNGRTNSSPWAPSSWCQSGHLLSPLSANYQPMLERGLLISSEQSTPVHATWPERGLNSWIGVSFYDSTNPAARDYFWEQVKKNYYKAGIRVFWLDACEPEMKPGYPASLRFAAGPGLEVANLYPREHARGFYEGMRRSRRGRSAPAVPVCLGW